MSDVVTFERPAKLMSMNDRPHWSVARRLARAWRQAAAWSAVDQLGTTPQMRLRGPSTVTVTLPVHGDHRRDPHNYFTTVKHVIDGLVDAGAWPDDTPEWVTTTEPRLELTKTRPGVVTVSIIPRASPSEERS
jgi:crossover junction endodeoxyribonuclease RusA